MPLRRHIPALLALLITAGTATAQANDGEWMSYRDAYRAMVVFEKYGKPKQFIQNQFQVMGRDRNAAVDGLQLTLTGKTIHLNLPLDATGRTVFPLLKLAYDENAALVLNRRPGQYVFRSRVSINVRPDGVYDSADLRAACEQVLAYQRTVEAGAGAKKCVGVRFVFARKPGEPGVSLRKGAAEASYLPAGEGAAFADDPGDSYRVVNYRFGDGAEKAQLITPNAPLAIAALID